MLFVISEAVGVELLPDRGVFGCFFLVLVEHPLEGAAVAELVLPCDGWHTAQRRFVVEDDDSMLFVRFEFRFVVLAFHIGALQWIWLCGFVVDVKVHELLAPAAPLCKIIIERYAREIAL